MPVLATEVGPIYDVLLATRDGTTIPCRNAQGQVVNLSQVALNFSIDRKNEQEEATELQHKKTITQLISPNASDRELEQWPQISQGDWSGGMYQRLYGQDGDTTRYWAGEGILWPLTDWAPQRLLPMGGESFGLNGQTHAPAAIAASGEYVGVAYQVTAGGTGFRVESASNNFLHTIGTINFTGSNGMLDMFALLGWWWVLGNAGEIQICAIGGGGANFSTLPGQGNQANYNANIGSCAGGYVGNQAYAAFPYPAVAGGAPCRIQLYNVTNTGGTTPANNSSITLNFDANMDVLSMEFLGDSLYIALGQQVGAGNGSSVVVIAYNIPNQTYTVVARLANYKNASITSVAGVLFIIAYSTFTFNSGVTKGELFLLQGSNLQDIGPLQIQLGSQQFTTFRSLMRPTSIGPYAVFGAVVNDGTNNFFVIIAYDVLRGRIFKAVQDQITEPTIVGLTDKRLAVSIAPYRTNWNSQGPILGDWTAWRVTGANSGVVYPTPFAYPYLCAPQSDSTGNYRASRAGVSLTSGIVDGTAGFEPKLFRSVQAQFTALPSDPSCSVTLDVWLDQDPSSLSASPQYTGTLTGSVGTAGLTAINLPINKVAIKLVYRLTTTGGTVISAGVWYAAPTPTSVAVQVATGWVWNVFLDLAPGVTPNGHGNETIWSRQQVPGQPTMDGVAAYNFLRQAWRLRGGRVTATWGNGDTWPALIQSESFRNPKPFAPSMRADQPSQLQNLCLLSVREDIA